jgi:hypothetical protein
MELHKTRKTPLPVAEAFLTVFLLALPGAPPDDRMKGEPCSGHRPTFRATRYDMTCPN